MCLFVDIIDYHVIYVAQQKGETKGQTEPYLQFLFQL